MSKTSRFIAHSLQHALPCSVACTVGTVFLVLFIAEPILTDRETLALILMSCGLTGLIWTAARVAQRHLAQPVQSFSETGLATAQEEPTDAGALSAAAR